MPISKHTTEFEGRPTLPSIHTLNLPSLSRSSHRNVKYDTHDNLRRTPTNNVTHHERHVSSSSSHTSASRNTSPSPLSDSDGETISPSTPQSSTKFRLVPCPLELAEAIIVVSDEPITSQPPNYAPQQGKGQSILILGPSVQRFRNPPRPLAKGSRIHPYRIVRDRKTSDLRRSSVVSITAFSPNTQ